MAIPTDRQARAGQHSHSGEEPRRYQGLGESLAPRNVPWFTVREGGCENGKPAPRIMDVYGEGRQFYLFPVIIPTTSSAS